MSLVVQTRPPAKLNLFLELMQRRDDGFHEIDTVMVPIDWCDELRICRRDQPGVGLTVQWLPSREVVAARLGVECPSEAADRLLNVPVDASNLVHRAIAGFVQRFKVDGGFDCRLGKRIPAGAGMGGASSDAAGALRLCAKLCGVPLHSPALWEIAAEVGSDVPFFLGMPGQHEVESLSAMRATGRGEVLQPAVVASTLHFVVAYPAVSLSTSAVYADCQVPHSPQGAEGFLEALAGGECSRFGPLMTNRLTEPAKKNAVEIDKILRSLWRTGLRVCQLTGSGSACFGIADSADDAKRIASQAKAMLEPGAMVIATEGIQVPAAIEASR